MTRLSPGVSGGLAAGSAANAANGKTTATNRAVRFINVADASTFRGQPKQKSGLRHPARPPGGPLLDRAARGARRNYRNRLRRYPRLSERRAAAHIRRRDPNEHEIRIASRPAQRLLFCFKESVDDNGIALEGGPAQASRGLAASHRRTGVCRDQSSIWQRNPTSVRNPTRIDRAMARPQARAACSDVLPRPTIRPAAAAGPIDSDAGEDGLFASESGWR